MDENDNGQVEEWIAEHHRKLMDAYDNASKKTEREALRRKTRNDLKADNTLLTVGTRVFLRNRGTKGRSKIHDVWNPEPYIVVDKLNTGGNTYVVEPIDGGQSKTVHRGEMLDSKSLAKDMELDGSTPVNDVVSSDGDDNVSNKLSCTGSDDEEYDLCVDHSSWQQLCSNNTIGESGGANVNSMIEKEVISLDVPSESVVEEPSASVKAGKQPIDLNTTNSDLPISESLRRTKRRNVGCHSNPYHLPKAVVSETSVVSQTDHAILFNIAQSNLIIMQMLNQN